MWRLCLKGLKFIYSLISKCNTFRIVRSLGELVPFINIKCPSLSLKIFFVLKSTLSDIVQTLKILNPSMDKSEFGALMVHSLPQNPPLNTVCIRDQAFTTWLPLGDSSHTNHNISPLAPQYYPSQYKNAFSSSPSPYSLKSSSIVQKPKSKVFSETQRNS
jgi:hypothetical protein